MSTAYSQRHPLGLPAGSVRSILILLVVGMICLLLLTTPVMNNEYQPIPPYLVYLLFLVVGSFFSAHGGSIGQAGQPSPFYLPHGVFRLIILAGMVATIVWKITNDYDVLESQARATFNELQKQPFLPLVILGGFFVGHLVRFLASGLGQSAAYQDILAWIALVAVILMAADILITVVVNPSLRQAPPLDLSAFEAGIAAIIAFYFAARS
jgi:hypothetical protein